MLAQIEEPSHCERLGAATRGIRSSSEHQRPGRNQCHCRITRTSTNQFPVSWNSVGGVGGQKRTTQSCTTWRVTRRRRRFRTCHVLGPALSDGLGGFFPWIRDDKRLPFTSDLSAPRKHKQTSLQNWEKRRLEGLYCFNYIFQLTYVAFKKSSQVNFIYTAQYLSASEGFRIWKYDNLSIKPQYHRRPKRNSRLPRSTILIWSTHSLASWGLPAVNW